MKCCGEDRTTPFCPMCGRRVESSPLHSLARMCRVNATDCLYQAEVWKEWGGAVAVKQPTIRDHCYSEAERHLADYGKWQTCHDELAELLSKREAAT